MKIELWTNKLLLLLVFLYLVYCVKFNFHADRFFFRWITVQWWNLFSNYTIDRAVRYTVLLNHRFHFIIISLIFQKRLCQLLLATRHNTTELSDIAKTTFKQMKYQIFVSYSLLKTLQEKEVADFMIIRLPSLKG